MAQQSAEFATKVDESHKGQEDDKNTPSENKQQNEEKNEAQKTENKVPSLFGSMINGQNLFNNNQTSSIFQGSLFGSSQPTTGIFSSGPSVLSNVNVDLTKPGPSLFGISYKAPKSDDSDPGEDDGQDEQKPEDDEPQQIVMKYNYTSNTEQLVKVNVEKFRKNTNDILEKGSVAIEKTKTGESYYLVYRNAIQQSLYTGQFVKGFSEIKPLGQKAENLIIKAISRKEKQDSKQGEQGEKDEKNSISVDILKVMFTTKEGAEEFKTEFAKIFQ
ncbi:unnamed protein product [Paramecium pentaurelia]|uniref:Uncharacterized protein n=1 Tax=Paramecium pentaurelia TaxID=43138 RepID=A0A8S1U965_9CILI|nr:unnamed protein product [Paramecium pentaurelia]